jgi:hypothetical protein
VSKKEHTFEGVSGRADEETDGACFDGFDGVEDGGFVEGLGSDGAGVAGGG